METLNKTIKKLNEQEYKELLSAVAGRKNNKPYLVLEAARLQNYDENTMMQTLGVNASTYYTLKSRLNEKIAQYLSQNAQNPISALKEKVAMVPAMLFGNDREVSIRALKNLEKQLTEYDLSNELIVVYKALARLSMYNGDFDFYEKEYNKHVAYSLSVVKAEDLFFEFSKRTGMYLLTRDERDLESVKTVLRELTNISELYHGHRLFVLFNIVRIYYLCTLTSRSENLKALEIEIDSILQQIRKHFETYEMDTFYQSIRFVVDFLYFEYYQRTGNSVRADHYYNQVNSQVPEVAHKPIFSFFVTQFLHSKLERFLVNHDISGLTDLNSELEGCFDVNTNEPYPFISFKKYQAISKFYEGDYNGAAKTINSLRNDMSLKKYLFSDVECKLFQALNYAMMGEDGLCSQLIQSIKRQTSEDESLFEPASMFIKLLKAAIKPEEFRKKVKKITELFEAFNAANTGSKRILWFVKMDESVIRKLANPIKE
ncbi:MAG: hypothetical protein NT126_05135 [Bacteroidetes bacterium]|nr:hypothetical protein [Bacteroidota bacterium]